MHTHEYSNAPFTMDVERDGNGRITRKTEHVAGGHTRELTYHYTPGGLLQIVERSRSCVEMYQYDQQDRRVASQTSDPMPRERFYRYQGNRFAGESNSTMYHDEHGFRSQLLRADGSAERYQYADDYRLLRVERDGSTIRFEHDERGQRSAKYVDGMLAEAYVWHDLVRLARVQVHGRMMEFHYQAHERIPRAMTCDGRAYRLYYDQVGSLRVVADQMGGVISEIVYDTFGRITYESNPAFRVPIGFAGGLHDREVGWVRFGYRDYDPVTGRFTAPDPIGYAGGDTDLHGYCLDDPVNNIDPLGLESFWNGPGGRIVESGVEGGLACAGPGFAWGSTLGPGGAAAGGAAGFMLCGAGGLLKGTIREAVLGAEDELPETVEHRKEAPKPSWK